MAGLAGHPSAEPDSLVIRAEPEERELWLEEAPAVYYLTEHYARYPVVLVRLSKVEPQALRELLAVSWRLTLEKARPRRPADRAATSRSLPRGAEQSPRRGSSAGLRRRTYP